MRVLRFATVLWAATAVMAVDLSAPPPGARDGVGPIRLTLGPASAEASRVGRFFRRIGRAFRRVGDKMKRGFQKAGKAIKRGFQKAGRAIKKGLKKVGTAIKKTAQKVGKAIKKGFEKVGKFFKDLGKKALAFLKKIKDKIVNGLKKFVDKIVNFAKGIFNKAVEAIIGKVADKLRLGIDDLERIIDMKTGKIRMEEVGKLLIQRLGDWVKPWLEDKVEDLLRKGFNFIRPYLDIAVKAVIGALGSIPFAGGVIAALASAGYSWGIEKLLEWSAKKLVGLVWKWASTLLQKGFNFLANKIAPLKRLLERVTKSALKLYGYMKKGGAVLKQATR